MSSSSEYETRKIDGKAIAQAVRDEIKLDVQNLKEQKNVVPGLAVILVGDRGDSATYVRMKKRAAEELGIKFFLSQHPADITQDDLLAVIDGFNANPEVDGLIVQLPVPAHINEVAVVSRVALEKDVDGFHAQNMGDLALRGRTPLFEPCTARGVLELLRREGVTMTGANAVVVGRSNIVGIPTALMLMHENATVTICHSLTKDLAEHVRQADIVVAAVGKAEIIKADWIKPGAVVIDVGTNPVPDEKKGGGAIRLVGDVDFAGAVALGRPRLITPVPGGVGPMTVAMLLQNTVASAKRRAAAAAGSA